MKHSTTSLLSWLTLLFAFVMGGVMQAYALSDAGKHCLNSYSHYELATGADGCSQPSALSRTWQSAQPYQLTFQDTSGEPLSVTVNGTTYAGGVCSWSEGQITKLLVNGLPIGKNTVATITSGGASAEYTGADILAAINALTADATLTFPTISLSFVDVNGLPMMVKANGKEYADGVISIVKGQELGALTLPKRLVSYTIGTQTGLNFQDAAEKVATLTADTEIKCNASYVLTFKDEGGNTINSQIRGGGVTLDYAASHTVGIQCVVDKVLLEGHTKLNYTYVLQGEEYDMIGLYEALAAIDVEQGSEVAVTVKENAAAVTVKDIYGNAIVPGNNYYVIFPGRSNYYFGTSGNGAANYDLKLNGTRSYLATADNFELFQVEGNGQYLRLKPSRSNMSGAYVASNDVTEGAGKVKLMTESDNALVFRAEKFVDYTNCYALRVTNHQGAVMTYLNNADVSQNMGFSGSADDGAFVQFVPFASKLTLNFVNTNGGSQAVRVYKNTDTNQGTAQGNSTQTSMSFDVPSASDKAVEYANLMNNRYFYINSSSEAMNAVKYNYNGTDYSTWEEVLSSGAAEAGGTVNVTLQVTGIQPLDINGNPVIAGRKYRIARYSDASTVHYLTKSAEWLLITYYDIRYDTDLLTDGTQYWTVTPAGADDWSTMQLSQDGDEVTYYSFFGSNLTLVGGTGTTINMRSILVDPTTHYYILEGTVSGSRRRLNGPNNNRYAFTTDNPTGVTAKFAFVPAGGIVDAYNSELATNRTYRIEMPAKVGQPDFPAGRPVTLTRTEVNSNSSASPTSAVATSAEQYSTYYWLPDTYTGLDYMYNDLQAWTVEPVSGTEAGYRIKSSNGYLKAASYADQAAVTVNASQSDATIFYGDAAEHDDLTNIYGLYTYASGAEDTKFYLCAPGANTAMKLTATATQSDTRWYPDCVFRFTPVKEQTLATAYSNGNVLAKGFDCYGPGKAGKGLVWNSSTQVYDESSSDIITAQNMLTGAGDKHDSIVGYHLPDRIFLAYDYTTSAYKETVDFTAPELIGYEGTITSTKNNGYYEFTGYTLKDYPILASPAPKIDDSGAYQFDAKTNWYMILLNDYDSKDVVNSSLQAVTHISSITNPFVGKYLYCFVGDEENGYLVYNKARGASHFLGPKGDQATWNEANNASWIANTGETTDAKRNKSRVFFQVLQHDHAGYTTFVDRYSGFSLENADNVVYWQTRPTMSGNGFSDNGSKSGLTEQSTQIGHVPNSFYRNTQLEDRTMGFRLAADVYAEVMENAIASEFFSGMVGYVGQFRNEQDIAKDYYIYRHRVAEASVDEGKNVSEYKAELTDAYKDFFNWLRETDGDYAPLTNGVEFSNARYYYLRNVASEDYLVVGSGSEGDASYALTTTTTPESESGAIWQFDLAEAKTDAYKSAQGNTHRLKSVMWNADLKLMNAAEGQRTASLVIDTKSFATLDVYNDIDVLENPGYFVFRSPTGKSLVNGDVCLAEVEGNVEARNDNAGDDEVMWYLKPIVIESPTSTDDWEDQYDRVETFTTVTIPDGTEWINGTTIGSDIADDLVFVTYCNPDRDVMFPHNSNIYAFRVDRKIGETAVFLEQLDDVTNNTIPAGMGVVMLAPNGKTIPFLPVASAGVTNTNSLLVSAGSELTKNAVAAGNFVFVYKKSGGNYVLKFYKVGSKGASLGYHRAYLPGTALEAATRSLSSFSFDMLMDDGTVTKVTLPITESEDGEDFNAANASTYDMQGRRVDNPAQSGVYIINGRKVFVK